MMFYLFFKCLCVFFRSKTSVAQDKIEVPVRHSASLKDASDEDDE